MPDRPPLAIVGAGGLGRKVAALIEAIDQSDPTWNPIGFVDDDETLHGESVMGYPVHGNVDWLARHEGLQFVIAVGSGEARRDIAEQLHPADVRPASLVHPSVSLHRTAEVAPGAIFCKGVATAVDFQIDPHVFLNLNCTIGHDSILEAFVTLHPGVHISGNAYLESGVTMGAGSVVLPGTRIGEESTIGAGAVVVDDLPAHCTAVGVPARPQS